MSEHFLGSYKGFEILANSGQDPLLVVVCETFASPDVFASGGAFNSVSVVAWETLACPDNA
jgi:hypothetical protein